MKLSERMKHWPALTVHRVAEIEATLVSFEERLTALEPKKVKPIDEPKPETEQPIVRLGPTPSVHDNPLDGTNLRS